MIRTAEGPKTMLQNLSSPIVASVVRFMRDERGATAIEYALLCGLIAIFIIGSLSALGTSISSEFSEVAVAMK